MTLPNTSQAAVGGEEDPTGAAAAAAAAAAASTSAAGQGDPAAAGGAEKTYSQSEVANLLKALKAEREARERNEKNFRDAQTQLEQLKGIDPEQYAKLQAEAAKRAELDAELAGRVSAIEKSYSEQLAAAKAEQEKAASQVADLQLQWAFEKAFTSAGGRSGEFTELAFSKLRSNLKLEKDGSLSIVDGSGAYVLEKDGGKRINPTDWVKAYKSHELLGYCFQPERGAGSGLMPGSGATGSTGVDLHNVSTAEAFRHVFGGGKR